MYALTRPRELYTILILGDFCARLSLDDAPQSMRTTLIAERYMVYPEGLRENYLPVHRQTVVTVVEQHVEGLALETKIIR
ncbi:hypothetical protein BDZ89DRAFT_1257989 [Hymenopellis radicata]|nr:hypothetical protein BDZ89DRAFT_1257989 [Hymenopellis radicata]